eukprot:g26226.t1
MLLEKGDPNIAIELLGYDGLALSSGGRRRACMNFLFVGEGDFGFSKAVSVLRGVEADVQGQHTNLFCVTSLDLADVVTARYFRAAAHLAYLSTLPTCRVLHNIDARNLEAALATALGVCTCTFGDVLQEVAGTAG